MRKSRSETKTLESTLSKFVNQREVIITSKLNDIDKDVPLHLGVSYSILENVIFCHQDESTWPVGDPSGMKKKLDDISISTKYNKALLGLKSTKKKISSDLKLKIQQLLFFLKEKTKRDEVLNKIKNSKNEMDKKNTKLKAFSDEISRKETNFDVISK